MKTWGLSYHQRVSYDRTKMTGHFLDWEHQPRIYKNYPGIEPMPLPQEVHLPNTRLSSLLKDNDTGSFQPGMDLRGLSPIFRLSYSLTAKARHSGGDFYYRSVASAGALYPAEIYVAAEGVTDLPDGLYHFSIAHHGLSQLRQGVFHPATLTFFITAIYFRSAWKYRERSYRYHLLDTGHVLENLVLALDALGLPCSLTFDFDDPAVNRLLGVDETREVCLAICSVPGIPGWKMENAEELQELAEDIRNQSRVSEKETAYPEIREIHDAGAIVSGPASAPNMIDETGLSPAEWNRVDAPGSWPEQQSFADAVLHRRSRRNFVKRPISKTCLTALLDGLCAGDPGERMENQTHDPSATLCTGFLAGAAEGFEPGFYLLDRDSRAWARAQQGFFMDAMAHICLDQMWTAHAAVQFVFLSNLKTVDAVWGPRGYRYAMMTAGRLGERLYLMAEAMGLGCCGIGAFYDTEAAALLGLSPDTRLLYLVAIGPVKSVSHA